MREIRLSGSGEGAVLSRPYLIRAPCSISDPSIKTTQSLSIKSSCVFDGVRGSKSSRKNNILTDCITEGGEVSRLRGQPSSALVG